MNIKDICKDYFWIMPKTPKYDENGKIPYITSKNLKDGNINYIDCKYINQESFNNLTSKRYIQEDDVLISMIGTIGEVGIVKKTDLPIYGQNMYLLRPNYDLIDKRYLYNFLTSSTVKALLLSIINGATQGYLHDKDIINLILKEIPLVEQKNIARELDLIRKSINLKYEQLNSYDTLIKSRFIEMFGTLENSIFPTYMIDDLCEFVRDGTHQTPTYTNDTINGYKFLSSKDVTTGKIDWSNIKYIPSDLHEKLYKVISPKKGDILLAKNGTTGTAALVDTDEVFDIYVSLALLRFKKGNNELYLLNAINSDDSKKQFNYSLVGVGVPNLHLGKIKKVKLIIPPIELQNEFADFVKLIDKSKFDDYSKYFL